MKTDKVKVRVDDNPFMKNVDLDASLQDCIDELTKRSAFLTSEGKDFLESIIAYSDSVKLSQLDFDFFVKHRREAFRAEMGIT